MDAILLSYPSIFYRYLIFVCFYIFWSFQQANYARSVASLSKAQAKKVARFLPNPEKHWGPKLRAGRTITSKHISILGTDAVNGVLNNDVQETDEPQAKRNKTEDSTSN